MHANVGCIRVVRHRYIVYAKITTRFKHFNAKVCKQLAWCTIHCFKARAYRRGTVGTKCAVKNRFWLRGKRCGGVVKYIILKLIETGCFFIQLCVHFCFKVLRGCAKQPGSTKLTINGWVFAKGIQAAKVQVYFQAIGHYRFNLQPLLKCSATKLYFTKPVARWRIRISSCFENIKTTIGIGLYQPFIQLPAWRYKLHFYRMACG